MDIVDFDLTPIHGRSCLVTFMKSVDDVQRPLPPSFQVAVQRELSSGLASGQMLSNFKRQAVSTRAWMHEQLQSLAEQGFRIVAYGAAAKGMVLLHYLRQLEPRSYDFDFIADDAPLKQGTYCPGTSIPVLPAANLSQVPPSQPLAIVIMPWNFLDEITLRIQKLLLLPREAPVVLVVPFPRQRLLQLHATIPPTDILPHSHATPQSHVQTALVGLLAVFTDDDAIFCRHFIQHHSSMFDFAVVVDRSTSSLVQTIFLNVAPSSWKLVNSSDFTLASLHPNITFEGPTWLINLRGHQFLVHPNIRSIVHEIAGHSLHFPVIRISEDSDSSVSGVCSDPLCHRTLAFTHSAGHSHIPIVRASFSDSWLISAQLSTAPDVNTNTASISSSSAEGFIADLQAPGVDEINNPQVLDLTSVFIDSAILKQAQAAWFQVFNRILRVGCRGCRQLNTSRREIRS